MRSFILSIFLLASMWAGSAEPPAPQEAKPAPRLGLAQKCRVAIWPLTSVSLDDSRLAEAIVGKYGFLRNYQNEFSNALSEGVMDALDKESLTASQVRDCFKGTDLVPMLDLRDAIQPLQPGEAVGSATPDANLAPVRNHAALGGVRYLLVPLQMTFGTEIQKKLGVYSSGSLYPGVPPTTTTYIKEVTIAKGSFRVALVDLETFTLVCTEEIPATAGNIKLAGVRKMEKHFIRRLRDLLLGKGARPTRSENPDAQED